MLTSRVEQGAEVDWRSVAEWSLQRRPPFRGLFLDNLECDVDLGGIELNSQFEASTGQSRRTQYHVPSIYRFFTLISRFPYLTKKISGHTLDFKYFVSYFRFFCNCLLNISLFSAARIRVTGCSIRNGGLCSGTRYAKGWSPDFSTFHHFIDYFTTSNPIDQITGKSNSQVQGEEGIQSYSIISVRMWKKDNIILLNNNAS